MPDLELMCEALAFIESHLQQPITVANMADAVGYSLYHFCRIFNAATHHTPYEYLMRRRLSKSVEALATSEAKIIDIAFDFQFNSHETYSRAFKRLLGVQPNQVRKGEWIDPHRLMPPLTRAHLEHLRNRAHLKPRLVNLESITIAGVMALVKEASESTTERDLWYVLAQMVTEAPIPASCYWGLRYYAKGWDGTGYLFIAGCQIPAGLAPPTALISKTLSPCRYAQFTHAGSHQDLGLTLDYIFHTWIPKSDHEMPQGWILTRHGPGAPEYNATAGETVILVPLPEA